MEKIQVYFPKDELEELRRTAKKRGRSVADMVREAVRRAFPAPSAIGPVGLWDGEPRRTSLDHDSIYDDK